MDYDSDPNDSSKRKPQSSIDETLTKKQRLERLSEVTSLKRKNARNPNPTGSIHMENGELKPAFRPDFIENDDVVQSQPQQEIEPQEEEHEDVSIILLLFLLLSHFILLYFFILFYFPECSFSGTINWNVIG
jgi:hypothetical protein